MSLRRALATMTLVAAAWATACDTGPEGPGTVEGTVTGVSDLGGVVLDVVWTGIQGFEGRGSTQIYSAEVPGETNRHRVILIDPTGGDLSFAITVDDVYLEGPVVTVVDATGTDNLPRPAGDLTVLLER